MTVQHQKNTVAATGDEMAAAGRVVRNMPAPKSLAIPPHAFVDQHRLEIGTDHAVTPEDQHGNA